MKSNALSSLVLAVSANVVTLDQETYNDSGII